MVAPKTEFNHATASLFGLFVQMVLYFGLLEIGQSICFLQAERAGLDSFWCLLAIGFALATQCLSAMWLTGIGGWKFFGAGLVIAASLANSIQLQSLTGIGFYDALLLFSSIGFLVGVAAKLLSGISFATSPAFRHGQVYDTADSDNRLQFSIVGLMVTTLFVACTIWMSPRITNYTFSLNGFWLILLAATGIAVLAVNWILAEPANNNKWRLSSIGLLVSMILVLFVRLPLQLLSLQQVSTFAIGLVTVFGTQALLMLGGLVLIHRTGPNKECGRN